jgi:hypothetical protein
MTLLCPECFADKGLQRRIVEMRPQFDNDPCTYHPRRKGVPIDAVAGLIDEVFRANFTYAGVDYLDDPDDPGAFAVRGSDLSDTILTLTQIDDFDALQALVDQLIEDDFYIPQRGEEGFYDEAFRYERILDDGGHSALWDRFCQTVTYEQRFTNPQVGELLGEIFQNIHLQRDVGRRAPVYRIGPNDKVAFLRARLIDDRDLEAVRLDPHGQLGAPPRRLGKSNRMNPAGVSAFYGGLDLETCISELRPIVGGQIVYGRFKPARELVLLDTTRFAEPPKELNIFARDHVRRLSQWRFMQRFMTEIAKPISPSDEPFDYVATQVVAEYLNKVHTVRSAREKRGIDGIIYRSAQRPAGANIVLLGDAARVDFPGDPRTDRSLSRGLSRHMIPPGLTLIEDSVMVTKVAAAEYPPGPSTPRQWWPRPPASFEDEDWPADGDA